MEIARNWLAQKVALSQLLALIHARAPLFTRAAVTLSIQNEERFSALRLPGAVQRL